MNQEWLKSLSREQIENDDFPKDKVISASLYYPASGCDGSPIRHWEIGVDCFVYADMLITKQDYQHAVSSAAFKGYELFAQRNLSATDLTSSGHSYRVPSSIDPAIYRNLVDRAMSDQTGAFAIWSVFERKPHLPQEHGPTRFSLIYIRGEGCATYQALYVSNALLPNVIALIRPGTGFGGNYSNFEDVLLETMRMHPLGLPPKLLSWKAKRSQQPFANCIQDLYQKKLLDSLSKDGEADFDLSLYGLGH
jgi:hypothetical protein